MGSIAHFISFKVGDGTQIEFWHDSWCGGQPLCERFLLHHAVFFNIRKPNFSLSFLHHHAVFHSKLCVQWHSTSHNKQEMEVIMSM